MKRIVLRCVFVLGLFLWAGHVTAGPVAVVVAPEASPVEMLAAGELASYLGRLYPEDSFRVENGPAQIAGRRILLGTPKSIPALMAKLDRSKLAAPESYLVSTLREDGGPPCGVIAGADPAGVLHGVYSLLGKLGFGFYLSFETAPTPRHGAWTPDGWDLADHPLVATRLVFNWHNFLSGCSSWNFPQWKQWVINNQKMGFNTIMVHAYGNNPMFTYSFNGIEKPVGYLPTSHRGRDWGNEHVNDVRRLPGGDVFDAAEFGCDAALVPDDQRIAAVQSLMKRVFALAESRGMDVCFAFDVDRSSMFPQEMVETLPETARFHNGSLWLPRPDTDEGYAFYKAQVVDLFSLYPEIDTLALWRRSTGVEWGKLKKPGHMPEAWRAEFNQHIAKKPAVAKLPNALASFALAKVTAAFRKALDETGHPDVQLAMGSWRTDWVPACAEFLPDDVTLMPLNWRSLSGRKGSFFKLPSAFSELKTAKHRILPIIWAHHDDGKYIGRPLASHEDLYDSLATLDAHGYGIIHWMTRPEDIYFKNHENQVWAATRNEAYAKTCRKTARDWFGMTHEEVLGQYLQDWWTDAPIFGRVTRDQFFLELKRRERISNPDQAIAGCRTRLALLNRIDTTTMTPRQRERLAYFKTLEETLISFCEVQEHAFRKAIQSLDSGNFKAARTLVKTGDPRVTIRHFAKLSGLAGGNRGEQAMVLSLGTRWITDYLAVAQAAGAEPLRINYGPTRHEALAQMGGNYTYHVDKNACYWSVRGTRETKRETVEVVADPESQVPEEIGRSGILVDETTTLPLSPLAGTPEKLAPGNYQLTLYLASGTDAAALDISVKGDIAAAIPGTHAEWKPGGNDHRAVKTLDFTLKNPGKIAVTLDPKSGRFVCCGAVLTWKGMDQKK